MSNQRRGRADDGDLMRSAVEYVDQAMVMGADGSRNGISINTPENIEAFATTQILGHMEGVPAVSPQIVGASGTVTQTINVTAYRSIQVKSEIYSQSLTVVFRPTAAPSEAVSVWSTPEIIDPFSFNGGTAVVIPDKERAIPVPRPKLFSFTTQPSIDRTSLGAQGRWISLTGSVRSPATAINSTMVTGVIGACVVPAFGTFPIGNQGLMAGYSAHGTKSMMGVPIQEGVTFIQGPLIRKDLTGMAAGDSDTGNTYITLDIGSQLPRVHSACTQSMFQGMHFASAIANITGTGRTCPRVKIAGLAPYARPDLEVTVRIPESANPLDVYKLLNPNAGAVGIPIGNDPPVACYVTGKFVFASFNDTTGHSTTFTKSVSVAVHSPVSAPGTALSDMTDVIPSFAVEVLQSDTTVSSFAGNFSSKDGHVIPYPIDEHQVATGLTSVGRLSDVRVRIACPDAEGTFVGVAFYITASAPNAVTALGTPLYFGLSRFGTNVYGTTSELYNNNNGTAAGFLIQNTTLNSGDAYTDNSAQIDLVPIVGGSGSAGQNTAMFTALSNDSKLGLGPVLAQKVAMRAFERQTALDHYTSQFALECQIWRLVQTCVYQNSFAVNSGGTTINTPYTMFWTSPYCTMPNQVVISDFPGNAASGLYNAALAAAAPNVPSWPMARVSEADGFANGLWRGTTGFGDLGTPAVIQGMGAAVQYRPVPAAAPTILDVIDTFSNASVGRVCASTAMNAATIDALIQTYAHPAWGFFSRGTGQPPAVPISTGQALINPTTNMPSVLPAVGPYTMVVFGNGPPTGGDGQGAITEAAWLPSFGRYAFGQSRYEPFLAERLIDSCTAGWGVDTQGANKETISGRTQVRTWLYGGAIAGLTALTITRRAIYHEPDNGQANGAMNLTNPTNQPTILQSGGTTGVGFTPQPGSGCCVGVQTRAGTAANSALGYALGQGSWPVAQGTTGGAGDYQGYQYRPIVRNSWGVLQADRNTWESDETGFATHNLHLPVATPLALQFRPGQPMAPVDPSNLVHAQPMFYNMAECVLLVSARLVIRDGQANYGEQGPVGLITTTNVGIDQNIEIKIEGSIEYTPNPETNSLDRDHVHYVSEDALQMSNALYSSSHFICHMHSNRQLDAMKAYYHKMKSRRSGEAAGIYLPLLTGSTGGGSAASGEAASFNWMSALATLLQPAVRKAWGWAKPYVEEAVRDPMRRGYSDLSKWSAGKQKEWDTYDPYNPDEPRRLPRRLGAPGAGSASIWDDISGAVGDVTKAVGPVISVASSLAPLAPLVMGLAATDTKRNRSERNSGDACSDGSCFR